MERLRTLSLSFGCAAYLAIAMLLAYRPHDPHLSHGIDIFLIGIVVMSTLIGALHLATTRHIFQTRELARIFGGDQFDPGFTRWTNILPMFELLAFFDYGHWRLIPSLHNPIIQSAGLCLYAATACWMWWVDRYLRENFIAALRASRIMSGGPYRFVRHPRYLALLLSRTAFALSIASAIGWAIWLLWVWIIVRRIFCEERYLGRTFDESYTAYARTHARLLPGVF